MDESRRRLIFIRKKWTGSTGWSDAIQRFYDGAAGRFSTAECLEVSISSLNVLRSANRALSDLAADGEPGNLVVLINHSICWWALSPTLLNLRRRGATICLCMHEHEHILGMSFVVRHLANFQRKEVLRYSRLFHGIPAWLSTRVMVLAEAQASVLGIPDALRSSYLPVDGKLFPAHRAAREPGSRAIVLFAHDPARFDKGHRFVAAAQAQTHQPMKFLHGRELDLPFDKVYLKYWDSDILFLPSDWESYSLVFVEALACNKFVVSSPRVGALRLLLAKYSIEQLESFGLFVSAHGATAYARSLDRAVARVLNGMAANTRQLFDEFAFDEVQLPVPLL